MKADNLNELIIQLKVIRSQIDILIDKLAFDKADKKFLRNITLDLRELYKSYYLKKG